MLAQLLFQPTFALKRLHSTVISVWEKIEQCNTLAYKIEGILLVDTPV
jgi:hypothetical protein